MRFPETFWQQSLDWHSYQFVTAVAKHCLHVLVHQPDKSGSIQDYERPRNSFKQPPETLFTAPQRILPTLGSGFQFSDSVAQPFHLFYEISLGFGFESGGIHRMVLQSNYSKVDQNSKL
jgi:hypothetical protein